MNMYKFTLIIVLALIHGAVFSHSVWQELADYEAPEQKKFAIIICSFNNKNWYQKNLDSAFSQDYPKDKFRIIYVDESRDGTADFVRSYVSALNQWDHFTLIRNETWQSLMPNHYKAAHMCQDDEIIIHLDGDDFLPNDQILTFLNKVYNKWDVWLTYGQYQDWPHGNIGFSTQPPASFIERNAFREFGFYYSHPRTFYAWLFKKIKLKDLMWKGSFIPTTPAVDVLFMFPMMEMAGQGHYKFIPDVLYLYNRTNSLSTCNMPIKLEIPPATSWQKYEPLIQKESGLTTKKQGLRADALVFSLDNPEEVSNFLQHELPQIQNLGTTIVLYRASSDEMMQKYGDRAALLKNIVWVNIDSDTHKDLLNILGNEHCLIITDVSLPMRPCGMKDCIYELERTYASAFFLGLSKQSFKTCNEKINYAPFPDGQIEYRLAFLSNGIAAWQFAYETYVLQDPLLFSAILVRKKDLENEINMQQSNFDIPVLKTFISNLMSKDREIGLLFEKEVITLS